MRQGTLAETQREALRSRIIGDNQIVSDEWKDATFLVTHNDIRVQLNFDTSKEHANDLSQPLIYSYAQDTYRQKILTGTNRKKFLSASDAQQNALCGILPLFIGMKVILTVNICIHDNLANGTQGIIRQIIYNENSISILPHHKNTFMLDKPPKYVIIELINTTAGSYKDLPYNHILIYPIKRECMYTAYKRDGSKLQKKFQRLQIPLTLAYAFTDYKCQGHTLQKVIIDLSISSAYNSTYVMLSCAQILNNLLILKLFKDS